MTRKAWLALNAIVLALIAAIVAGVSTRVDAGRIPLPADKVVVYKSQRVMMLMRNGALLGHYKIALGLNPRGHKEREGDFRTPEGQYRLTRRNPNSDYFLSIQVSYPNNQDKVYARRQGHKPGGAIMIHGWPNLLRHPPRYYEQHDWTDGCIAVSNSDMVEIWLLTQYDTPIEILP